MPKKSITKKSPAPKKGSNSEASSSTKEPLVTAQPQSKQQAALQAHIYLETTDAWSNQYFDDNDLRCMERKLFG